MAIIIIIIRRRRRRRRKIKIRKYNSLCIKAQIMWNKKYMII